MAAAESRIFEFAKFYWLPECRGLTHITIPNFVKLVNLSWRYCYFLFLKMAATTIINSFIHQGLRMALAVFRRAFQPTASAEA